MSGTDDSPSLSDVLDGKADAVVTQENDSKVEFMKLASFLHLLKLIILRYF